MEVLGVGIDVVGNAKRVRIYVNENERVGRSSASLALLEFLRRENAQGASVVRATSGFGASGQIHVPHLVDAAQPLPVIVEWIDRTEVVARLLPRVKELVPHALITIDDTAIVQCEPHPVRDVPAALVARDVMSRDVNAVTKQTPVRDVVEAMMGRAYRAVPVVEDGAPVGIVTNSDLVAKGGLGVRVDLLSSLDKPGLHSVLDRLSQEDKVAADVMTGPVVTVNESVPLPEIASVMTRKRLKRLPVVDDAGRLAGMVSRIDLLRAAAGSLQSRSPVPREMGLSADAPLSTVMRRDIPLVHPDTPLPEVFQAVVATRLNRALVVDRDQRVVGIVTDAELLERVTPSLHQSAIRTLMRRLPFAHPGDGEDGGAYQHARARKAADLMRREVASTPEQTLLSDAIALMLDGSHKVLAVTDATGRLVGIVDRADLLHGLAPAR